MKVLPLLAFAVVAGAAAPATTPNPGAPPKLAFPVACEPGRTCEIQHYVDRDPGPAARDYTCATKTYEGHTGVDIRLPDMVAERRGVAVLAAAPGVVLRIRDGVPDRAIGQGGIDPHDPQGCGNAVVIDHGGGWVTGYCHMAMGSIAVKPGQRITTGQTVGKVGLSGLTEFPHVHVEVRHDGQVVDPFAPDMSDPGPCRPQTALWTAQALAKMPYRAGAILNAGFADRQLSNPDLENGSFAAPTRDSPILIVYGRAIALLPGDEVELSLTGPGGLALHDRKAPLQRWRAQDLSYIGKKRPADGWPSGLYVADYRVWRAGKVALSRHLELRL